MAGNPQTVSTPLAEPATVKPHPRPRSLAILLASALAIRAAVFLLGIGNGPFYPDEFEYLELAKNLVSGEGFSYQGKPTSFRPPAFPFMIAALFRLLDTDSLVPIRALQMLFSLATVWVAYRIGRDGWHEKVGLVAAGIFAFYPSLLGYNNMLLTEPSCLFFVSLACWFILRHFLEPKTWRWAIAAGIALGLGTLIRDTLFYAGLVTTLFLIAHRFWDQRFGLRPAVAFAAGFIATLAPWIIRNTLLQGQFMLISTIGGLNLYLCNSEQTPLIHTGYVFINRAQQSQLGYYYDDVFPELQGASEALKQNLAMRKGLEYMWANPGVTLLRSLSRFVDFWGQERLVINQVLAKYYGRLPSVAILFIALAVCISFSSLTVAAIFGFIYVKLQTFDLYGLVFVVCYTGMHVLVQGHPRYHLALLPIMAIVAARAFWARADLRVDWHDRRFLAAMGVTALFVTTWIVGVFFFDSDKVEMFLRMPR